MWVLNRIAWLSSFLATITIVVLIVLYEDEVFHHRFSIIRIQDKLNSNDLEEKWIGLTRDLSIIQETQESQETQDSQNSQESMEKAKFGMSPKDYPNPLYDPQQCGIDFLLQDRNMSYSTNSTSNLVDIHSSNNMVVNDKEHPLYLCDPSGVLTHNQLLQIQTTLNNFTQAMNIQAYSNGLLHCDERRFEQRRKDLRRTLRSKFPLEESPYQDKRLLYSIYDDDRDLTMLLGKKQSNENPVGKPHKRPSDSWTYANRDVQGRHLTELMTTDASDDQDDDSAKVYFDQSIGIENRIDQIRIAVAIVDKINLRAILHALSYYTYEDEDDMVNDAAQYFSEYLYDSWKLGAEKGSTMSSCGPTGILIFLSVKDRVCFISTGRKVTSILPWWRLETVISNIKPYLHHQQYDQAILSAIENLGELIALGPPTMSDRFKDFLERFGVVIVFALFTFVFAIWGEYRDRWNRWQITESMSRLNQKEKIEARQLQKEYHCTACPICLENFVVKDPPVKKQPRWLSGHHKRNTNNTSTEASNENEKVPMIGSDGRPLKLLRCGHVFDETCWKSWVSSGQGNPYVCPICRQNVGGKMCRIATEQTTSSRNEGSIGNPGSAENAQHMQLVLSYGTFESQNQGTSDA